MSQETIRVMLVDDITDTRENLKKLLFFEDDIEVVGTAGSGEEGIELAKRIRPDVVIMDINMPGIDGISAAGILTREVPGVQIIMMSVQGEADYLRRSMLAGAREFLIKPPSAEEIVTSIRRVHKLNLTQRPAALPPMVAPMASANGASAAHHPVAFAAPPPQPVAEPGRNGEVIAVFGAKGGVGTTSIAVNLAVALRERRPDARVAVVDGNTEFGDLSVLLNLNANRTIVDLISIEELEPQYLHDALISHASGIKVMPGSAPTEAELVTNDQVRRVLQALRRAFDYVIFDTRPTFAEPILTVLDDADTIVLVTTSEIPSIRNARLFFEVAEQLSYAKSKVKLVLNKHEPQVQGAVSAQAIQASIKHPIVAELPRDDRTARSAIQHGLPYAIGHARTPLALATGSLANALLGVVEPPKATKAAEPDRKAKPIKQPAAPTPAAPKRSLWGKLFGR